MIAEVAPSLGLIALSVMSGVLGQTAIKLGVQNATPKGLAIGDPLEILSLILHSPFILLGLVLYGVGALSWIVVLSRLELSYAYPFLALNFVLIAFISRWFLAESIPGARWVGIGVICLGILIVAQSAPSK